MDDGSKPIVSLTMVENVEMKETEPILEIDVSPSELFTFTATSRPVAPPPASSDSSSSEEEEDSDSDCGGKWKRARTKPPNTNKAAFKTFHAPKPAPPSAPSSGLPRKYSVWSNVLLEQDMVSSLNTVAVRHAERNNDRQSESYDYQVKFERDDGDLASEDRRGSSYHHRGDHRLDTAAKIHRRYGLKRSAKERLGVLPALERAKRSFDVSVNDSTEKVISGIATILREPKTDLIERVVKTLGKEKALDLLSMTEDIEENGGLMILDQSRRRTPGGVYLFLLRKDTDISRTEKDIIFEEDRKLDAKRKKEILKARNKSSKSGFAENSSIADCENEPLPPLPTRSEVLLTGREIKTEQDMECADTVAESSTVDSYHANILVPKIEICNVQSASVYVKSESLDLEDGELSDVSDEEFKPETKFPAANSSNDVLPPLPTHADVLPTTPVIKTEEQDMECADTAAESGATEWNVSSLLVPKTEAGNVLLAPVLLESEPLELEDGELSDG